MTTSTYLTKQDESLLSILLLKPQEKEFLRALWAKLKSDNMDSGTSSIKLHRFFVGVMVANLVCVSMAIFNARFVPLANICVAANVLVGVLSVAVMALMLLGTLASASAQGLRDKSAALALVNRKYIGLMPTRRTPFEWVLYLFGWATIAVTLAAGYLFTGLLLLIIRAAIALIVRLIRMSIQRMLDEGTAAMFPESLAKAKLVEVGT